MRLVLGVIAVIALALSPLASALPTPGVGVPGRVFPEPLETNDFIGFSEFVAGLNALDQQHPDYVEVVEAAQSFGWKSTVTGSHDTFPVYAVEVTNEKSAKSRDEKKALVFQLSIHGNEKGGREGGMRVIEDLAAGLYYPEEFRSALDDFILVFTFPNVDGWVHEEAEYRANCPGYFSVDAPNPVTGDCVETQSYVRYNGNGKDMNRDYPTIGWYQSGGGRGNALSEPEIAGLAAYVLQFKGRAVFATDIHGMLQPADGQLFTDALGFGEAYGRKTECLPSDVPVFGGSCIREGHFVLSLLPSAQETPTGHLRNVRLAELTKERLNALAAERYPYWYNLPNLGYAGGDYNEYGTTWDTIGYTDSGTTGEFFAQFLEAEGFDFELSYNHITFDDKYVPTINDMHVHIVREIVRAYVDAARAPVFAAVKTNEHRAAYLLDPGAVESGSADGPHLEASADDAFEAKVRADINAFFADMADAVDGPLVALTAAEVSSGKLAGFDRLIIPGNAADAILDDGAAVAAIKVFVEAGNKLVLMDSAARLLPKLGAVEAEPEEVKGYLGYINLRHDSSLAKEIRGLAREIYSGITIGYPLPESQGDYRAPIWTVPMAAVEGANGAVAGVSGGDDKVSLAEIPLGKGKIVLIGALLPPPNPESYQPYGLASYAVTATGFQVLYNALDFTLTETEEEPGLLDQILAPTGTDAGPQQTPGFELLGAALGLAGVGALARRRRL